MVPAAFTLVDPQTGNLAFKIFSFEDNSYFDHILRNNYYSLIWVREGSGSVKADFSSFDFEGNTLLAFSPYQPFMISAGSLRGWAIQFHPDFFCIHKHQAEVACNGVLFNNVYDPPFVVVDEKAAITFSGLIEQMKTEIKQPALAQSELLVSYLKILLITASRLKNTSVSDVPSAQPREPFILQTLKEAIESNYREVRAPSDYAALLNISLKALAKITKSHFNKTLTDLISERVVIEAKRELYLTNKTVKEIAFELGYPDEHYFSRFFKTNTAISPQLYRETVGFGREG
jgi:AraC-like DNA-binding protein